MARVAATFGGVLVLALLAAGLTEVTLALGDKGKLSNDTALRSPAPSKSITPTPTTTPTNSTATPTPLATPAPSATPAAATTPTATTNGFVHMRSGASIYTSIVTDLNAGTVVELLPYADAQWQQVRYQGQVGYIFKTYLTY